MKATRLLPYISIVLAACGGGVGSATFEIDGQAESILNPFVTTQTQDIQIEGDRADTDSAHSVVFFLDVPMTPGAFDCSATTPTVTYYGPAGSTPGQPSYVAPTWAASFYLAGTSCSGEWQRQGSRMVGSFRATMTPLLDSSAQTREASGTFDLPMGPS